MARKTPSRRKNIPLWVKLEVALAKIGLTIEQVQFDHHPALALREWDADAGDTIPRANDPAYIRLLVIADHKTKTFGPGGEKRITTAGSDIHAIAKVRRLARKQEAFRQKLLAREPGEKRKPRGRIASRPFPKRPKGRPGHV